MQALVVRNSSHPVLKIEEDYGLLSICFLNLHPCLALSSQTSRFTHAFPSMSTPKLPRKVHLVTLRHQSTTKQINRDFILKTECICLVYKFMYSIYVQVYVRFMQACTSPFSTYVHLLQQIFTMHKIHIYRRQTDWYLHIHLYSIVISNGNIMICVSHAAPLPCPPPQKKINNIEYNLKHICLRSHITC